MNFKKIGIFALIVIGILTIFMSVSTLMLDAQTVTNDAKTEKPSGWANVCCGPGCGGDYCNGDGVYKCCKT